MGLPYTSGSRLQGTASIKMLAAKDDAGSLLAIHWQGLQ
jgi:hypothetical protein